MAICHLHITTNFRAHFASEWQNLLELKNKEHQFVRRVMACVVEHNLRDS